MLELQLLQLKKGPERNKQDKKLNNSNKLAKKIFFFN